MDINPSNPASSSTYISGRKKWTRPQGMLWSDNSGNLISGVRYPIGNEKEDFIILSDHNRQEIKMDKDRIETRQRMVNGTMRSYHIADKTKVSVSWKNLPSRSFSRNVIFSSGGSPTMLNGDTQYTVDGGAGGVEILDWYENHSGPFWVYLAYDKYNSNSFKVNGYTTDESFNYLGVYNEIKQMYFSSFQYTVSKRGSTNFDFWDIDVELEEV